MVTTKKIIAALVIVTSPLRICPLSAQREAPTAVGVRGAAVMTATAAGLVHGWRSVHGNSFAQKTAYSLYLGIIGATVSYLIQSLIPETNAELTYWAQEYCDEYAHKYESLFETAQKKSATRQLDTHIRGMIKKTQPCATLYNTLIEESEKIFGMKEKLASRLARLNPNDGSYGAMHDAYCACEKLYKNLETLKAAVYALPHYSAEAHELLHKQLTQAQQQISELNTRVVVDSAMRALRYSSQTRP